MRLYSRQLKSVKDLKKEKEKLIKQKEADEKTDKKSKNEDDGSFGALGAITSLISGDSVTSMVLRKAVPLLLKSKKSKAEKQELAAKKQPGIVMKIAKEFVFGYIKWKILELLFKLVRNFVRKRKERKRENEILSSVK